jgi:hypothetical protein
MKGTNNSIDEILDRYLPRASDQEVQSAPRSVSELSSGAPSASGSSR